MLRDLKQFTEDSVNELNSMKIDLDVERPFLNQFLEKNVLRSLSTDKIILQDRVKSPESLSEKIIRKTYYEKYNGDHKTFVSNLPDLIGIRIVCFLNDDEEVVVKDLNRIFSVESKIHKGYKVIPALETEGNLHIELKESPDYQKNQNPIYKFSCIWMRNDKSFNVEIQVKSLIHMFWGELEHMLIYKNYNYLVDSNFYSEIMDSTYHLLKNVDNQLKVIQNHLHNIDKSKEIKEVKEIIAKILHKNIQTQIEGCLNCKIDLRELYDCLVSISFYNVTKTNKVFEKANHFIAKATHFTLNEDQLNLNSEDLKVRNNIGQAEGVKELSELLDNLLKSNDIYWSLLYITYGYLEMDSEDEYTTKIQSIADSIIKLFRSSYLEDITINEEAAKYLNSAILASIINALNSYRKIDFINKRDRIIKVVSEFIQDNQESIEDLTNEERNQQVLDCIIRLLASQILITIKGEISRSDIQSIVDNYMNKEIKWQPNIEEKELLEKFIQGEDLPIDIVLRILQGEKLGEESYAKASN